MLRWLNPVPILFLVFGLMACVPSSTSQSAPALGREMHAPTGPSSGRRVAAATDLKEPYVLVLGTAQDAGLPQIGCAGPHCSVARQDPQRRRWSSSLLLCDPASGSRWLFDASPDMREQLFYARKQPSRRRTTGKRPPLVEGIFISHAHIGHYAGLMFLGRESYGAKKVPVYGTTRLRGFLTQNGPWSQLVSLANIHLLPLEPGQQRALTPGLSVRAIAVPHRDEFSDTVAFVIQGPRRSVLYLPDIDKWGRWSRPIEEVVAGVDAALLDGTFFDGSELPGRAMSEIPHPFIRESLKRFSVLPLQERKKIVFTHLNHSNPVQDPKGAAARAVRAQGMRVAVRGMRFAL